MAEGDSEDATHSRLYERMGRDDTLLKVDHGGPKFGSVDHPQRWAQIARVCNAVMDALPPDLPVIYVESDLVWEPDTMVQLLDDLERGFPAVAPMSMFGGGFYDTWGHRGKDGSRFQHAAPYHPSLNGDDLIEISSAGSCVVMRADIARQARFGDNDCIVGLGRDIRLAAGGSLWLDTRVSVFHP